MKNIKIMIEGYNKEMYPTLNEHIKATDIVIKDGIRHVNAMWGDGIKMTLFVGTVVDEDGKERLMGKALIDGVLYCGTFDSGMYEHIALVKGYDDYHCTNAMSYCVVKTIMDELTKSKRIPVVKA